MVVTLAATIEAAVEDDVEAAMTMHTLLYNAVRGARYGAHGVLTPVKSTY